MEDVLHHGGEQDSLHGAPRLVAGHQAREDEVGDVGALYQYLAGVPARSVIIEEILHRLHTEHILRLLLGNLQTYTRQSKEISQIFFRK